MKNYKPKISYLENNHVTILNEMGFRVQGFGSENKKLNEQSTSFRKYYKICGGYFELKINLEYYSIGENEVEPYVKIKSPRDDWWSNLWNIEDFFNELNYFEKILTTDILKLSAHEIIEEEY